MTRLEFLEDTVKYYSENVNRRCVGNDYCFYNPKNAANLVSDGCAIGRHLDCFTQKLLDGMPSDSSVSNLEVFEQLPMWMQKLGQKFLTDIQDLHDNGHNWSENGLTERGKKRVSEIKIEYNL